MASYFIVQVFEFIEALVELRLDIACFSRVPRISSSKQAT
jgi:hypothetical protein